MKQYGEIIIYNSSEGNPNIEVKFVDGTLWLDPNQISNLFQVDRTSVVRHINNIYKSSELDKKATCAKIAQVQKEGDRKVKRNVQIYNLDLIISVGYRVNTKRGTEFRIWANKIIKDHLVKGYSINEERLHQLKKTIKLISRISKNNEITEETNGLISVLNDYTRALDILDDYDHQKVKKLTLSKKVVFNIDYDEAIKAIKELRNKFGASKLFGNEKDESFKSSIAVIDQTFDGDDLYPSLEEKAANLLYLVVKNHSFTDGNKRIAAWLFVWYLDKNQFLYNTNGTKKIANNALVALTLMIAESKPEEKNLIINIITNLINSDNE